MCGFSPGTPASSTNMHVGLTGDSKPSPGVSGRVFWQREAPLLFLIISIMLVTLRCIAHGVRLIKSKLFTAHLLNFTPKICL